MKPEISEFSFGFAAVESLIRSLPGGVQGAPFFPTQASEGKDGGFDVRLDSPGGLLFVQFKRSDVMTRRSAIGSDYFPGRFYRFHLYSRMEYRQHQLLCDLEKTGRTVFYCAPRFSRVDELNQAYVQETVLERSIFFTPLSLSIDSLDGSEHTVSYDDVSDFGILRSTPIRVQATTRSELAEAVHRITSTRQPIRNGLREVYTLLASLASRHLGSLDQPEQTATIEGRDAGTGLSREIARLCRLVVGCECVALWRS